MSSNTASAPPCTNSVHLQTIRLLMGIPRPPSSYSLGRLGLPWQASARAGSTPEDPRSPAAKVSRAHMPKSDRELAVASSTLRSLSQEGSPARPAGQEPPSSGNRVLAYHLLRMIWSVGTRVDSKTQQDKIRSKAVVTTPPSFQLQCIVSPDPGTLVPRHAILEPAQLHSCVTCQMFDNQRDLPFEPLRRSPYSRFTWTVRSPNVVD